MYYERNHYLILRFACPGASSLFDYNTRRKRKIRFAKITYALMRIVFCIKTLRQKSLTARNVQFYAEKEEQKSYRKSKLSIVILVFTFISLFMMFSAFGTRHILSGIIALFQTGLFAVSWLMGMRILQDKKRFLHVAFAMLGFLLLIPYMMCGQESGKQEELRWPTRGLAQQIPDPKEEYGNILVDDTDKLYASIDQYSARKRQNMIIYF